MKMNFCFDYILIDAIEEYFKSLTEERKKI